MLNAPRWRASWPPAVPSPSTSAGTDSTRISTATTTSSARTMLHLPARSSTAFDFATLRDTSGMSGAGCITSRRRLPSIAAANDAHAVQ